MSDIYKRIKQRRLELGMSQQELADKLGYNDRTSIAKIEAGNVDLPLTKFKKLADALETTESDLAGWDGTFEEIDINAKIIADVTKDNEMIKCLELYYSYSEEKKRLIRNTIINLKDC